MNNQLLKPKNQTKTWTVLPSLGLCLLLLSACTTTEKVAVNQADVNCAFLAKDCALLTVGGKDEAGLRYINPAAQLTQYHKVLLDPVTFWGGDSTKIPASDQQMLVNYFSQQLKEKLGEKFEIVNQAGPGAMKIDVAIVDAEAATPVLRSISMIVPQAHMLANLKYMSTDSLPFIGAAQAEGKITDSVLVQVL